MAAVQQRKLVHKQFNSPIGLYSDQNVKETLNREIKAFGGGGGGGGDGYGSGNFVNGDNDGIEIDNHHQILGKPSNLQNSAVLKMLEEEESERYTAANTVNQEISNSRQSRPRKRFVVVDRDAVLKINRRHPTRLRDYSWPPPTTSIELLNSQRACSSSDEHFDKDIRHKHDIDQLKEMFDKGTIYNCKPIAIDATTTSMNQKLIKQSMTTPISMQSIRTEHSKLGNCNFTEKQIQQQQQQQQGYLLKYKGNNKPNTGSIDYNQKKCCNIRSRSLSDNFRNNKVKYNNNELAPNCHLKESNVIAAAKPTTSNNKTKHHGNESIVKNVVGSGEKIIDSNTDQLEKFTSSIDCKKKWKSSESIMEIKPVITSNAGLRRSPTPTPKPSQIYLASTSDYNKLSMNKHMFSYPVVFVPSTMRTTSLDRQKNIKELPPLKPRKTDKNSRNLKTPSPTPTNQMKFYSNNYSKCNKPTMSVPRQQQQQTTDKNEMRNDILTTSSTENPPGLCTINLYNLDNTKQQAKQIMISSNVLQSSVESSSSNKMNNKKSAIKFQISPLNKYDNHKEDINSKNLSNHKDKLISLASSCSSTTSPSATQQHKQQANDNVSYNEQLGKKALLNFHEKSETSDNSCPNISCSAGSSSSCCHRCHCCSCNDRWYQNEQNMKKIVDMQKNRCICSISDAESKTTTAAAAAAAIATVSTTKTTIIENENINNNKNFHKSFMLQQKNPQHFCDEKNQIKTAVESQTTTATAVTAGQNDIIKTIKDDDFYKITKFSSDNNKKFLQQGETNKNYNLAENLIVSSIDSIDDDDDVGSVTVADNICTHNNLYDVSSCSCCNINDKKFKLTSTDHRNNNFHNQIDDIHTKIKTKLNDIDVDVDNNNNKIQLNQNSQKYSPDIIITTDGITRIVNIMDYHRSSTDKNEDLQNLTKEEKIYCNHHQSPMYCSKDFVDDDKNSNCISTVSDARTADDNKNIQKQQQQQQYKERDENLVKSFSEQENMTSVVRKNQLYQQNDRKNNDKKYCSETNGIISNNTTATTTTPTIKTKQSKEFTEFSTFAAAAAAAADVISSNSNNTTFTSIKTTVAATAATTDTTTTNTQTIKMNKPSECLPSLDKNIRRHGMCYTDGLYIWGPYDNSQSLQDEIYIKDNNNNKNFLHNDDKNLKGRKQENIKKNINRFLSQNDDSIETQRLQHKQQHPINIVKNKYSKIQKLISEDLRKIDHYMESAERALTNAEQHLFQPDNIFIFETPLQTVVKRMNLNNKNLYDDDDDDALQNQINNDKNIEITAANNNNDVIDTDAAATIVQQINIKKELTENIPIVENILFDLYNLSLILNKDNNNNNFIDTKKNIDLTATSITSNHQMDIMLYNENEKKLDRNSARIIEINDNDDDDNDDNVNNDELLLSTGDRELSVPPTDELNSIGTISPNNISVSISGNGCDGTGELISSSAAQTPTSISSVTTDKILHSKNILSGYLIMKQNQEELIQNIRSNTNSAIDFTNNNKKDLNENHDADLIDLVDGETKSYQQQQEYHDENFNADMKNFQNYSNFIFDNKSSIEHHHRECHHHLCPTINVDDFTAANDKLPNDKSQNEQSTYHNTCIDSVSADLTKLKNSVDTSKMMVQNELPPAVTNESNQCVMVHNKSTRTQSSPLSFTYDDDDDKKIDVEECRNSITNRQTSVVCDISKKPVYCNKKSNGKIAAREEQLPTVTTDQNYIIEQKQYISKSNSEIRKWVNDVADDDNDDEKTQVDSYKTLYHGIGGRHRSRSRVRFNASTTTTEQQPRYELRCTSQPPPIDHLIKICKDYLNFHDEYDYDDDDDNNNQNGDGNNNHSTVQPLTRQYSYNSNINNYENQHNSSNSAIIHMSGQHEWCSSSEGYRRVAWPPRSESRTYREYTPQPPSQQQQNQDNYSYQSQSIQSQYPQQQAPYSGRQQQQQQQEQQPQHNHQLQPPPSHQPYQPQQQQQQQKQQQQPYNKQINPSQNQNLSNSYPTASANPNETNQRMSQPAANQQQGYVHPMNLKPSIQQGYIQPQQQQQYQPNSYANPPQKQHQYQQPSGNVPYPHYDDDDDDYPSSQYPQQYQQQQYSPSVQMNAPNAYKPIPTGQPQYNPQSKPFNTNYNVQPQQYRQPSPSLYDGQNRGWTHVPSPVPVRSGPGGGGSGGGGGGYPQYGSDSNQGQQEQPMSGQYYQPQQQMHHPPQNQYHQHQQPPIQSQNNQYYNQQPQQQQQHHHQQYNPQATNEPTNPGVITLRRETPTNQPAAPVIVSQPAAKIFRGGSVMRGDLKWPPQECREKMAAEAEWERQLSMGPAQRPTKRERDYSGFFAKHALSHNYPGYKIPPGTQHIAVSF